MQRKTVLLGARLRECARRGPDASANWPEQHRRVIRPTSSFWELSGALPRCEVLPKIAQGPGRERATNCWARHNAKPGEARQEAGCSWFSSGVSKLPRRQQQKIVEIVEAFVASTVPTATPELFLLAAKAALLFEERSDEVAQTARPKLLSITQDSRARAARCRDAPAARTVSPARAYRTRPARTAARECRPNYPATLDCSPASGLREAFRCPARQPECL